MQFEGALSEIVEKTKACKSPEEVLELAKEEGVELTDEQLEEISGGASWNNNPRDYHFKYTCFECGAIVTSGEISKEEAEKWSDAYNPGDDVACIACPTCGKATNHKKSLTWSY